MFQRTVACPREFDECVLPTKIRYKVHVHVQYTVSIKIVLVFSGEISFVSAQEPFLVSISTVCIPTCAFRRIVRPPIKSIKHVLFICGTIGVESYETEDMLHRLVDKYMNTRVRCGK